MVARVVNDLRNPFFTEMAIATQTALMRMGYVTVIANTDEDPSVQDNVIHSMLERDVSAFVICPARGSNEAALDVLKGRNVPVLQVLRSVPDACADTPLFTFDYGQGGRLAADHLRQLGVKRPVFVGGFEENRVTHQRRAGFAKVFEEAGIPVESYFGRPTRQFGRDIVDELFDQLDEIDALYCFNDRVALGCVQQAARRGIKVGPELKIVGFDDIDEAVNSEPSLTTIRCDISGFGTRAAQHVSQWLTDGQAPANIGLWGCELVARNSTKAG
jgi:LacI family transcriptional regulator